MKLGMQSLVCLLAVGITGCGMDIISSKPPPSATSKSASQNPSPSTFPTIPPPSTSPTGSPATQPVSPLGTDMPDEAQTWQTIAANLGKTGEAKDHVYTVTVPRDDLQVTIDGMAIPTSAGIESVFRFYRCPCGKLNVVGQFCVAEYESNDVAAALENARFDVASMSPMFLYDKPRMMLLRFQGEGSPEELGKTLHDALGWMGPERTMPQKSSAEKNQDK